MEKTTEQIRKLVSELFEKLRSVERVLITNEQYDKEDDIIYDAPRTFTVSDSEYHIEVVILEIKKNGLLVVGGLNDEAGERGEMAIWDMTIDDALTLSEYLMNN